MSNGLRAAVKWIDPDMHAGWADFEKAEIPEPWDHFEWFTVCIGPESGEAGDNFNVCVATHAAAGRANPQGGFRGVLVDYFEPAEVQKAIAEYVSSLKGLTWEDILNQLRQVMRWEYEGMGER